MTGALSHLPPPLSHSQDFIFHLSAFICNFSLELSDFPRLISTALNILQLKYFLSGGKVGNYFVLTITSPSKFSIL